MSQCPVRAVPAGPLRIKDLADPFGKRKRVIHAQITVRLDGMKVGAAAQAAQLRHVRRQIRDEGDEGNGPGDA